MQLSREKLEEVGECLRGTCKSISEVIENLQLGDEVDETKLQDDLLDVEIEICAQCGWWHEVCELQASEEHGGGFCEQCCDELNIKFY